MLLYLFSEQEFFKQGFQKREGKLDMDVPLNGCQEYRQKCFALYKRLRYPDPKYISNPAIKEIPKELYKKFTQNGYLPLTKNWYFNEVYSDSFSDEKTKKVAVDVANFNMYRKKVRNWEPLGYEDKYILYICILVYFNFSLLLC